MRFFAALALAGCAAGIPPDSPTGTNPDPGGGSSSTPSPPPAPTGPPIGSFHVDYYYLPLQSDYGGANSAELADTNCTTLAIASQNFYWDAVDAGAGVLTDGRVLAALGPCTCPQSPICFEQAPTPWGVGATGRPLAPFRSIAVNGGMLSVGTKVYAPSLAGKKMPGSAPSGGFVHDGCLVVDDKGADRTRMDFFTGLKAYEQSLSQQLGASLDLYPAAGYCL